MKKMFFGFVALALTTLSFSAPTFAKTILNEKPLQIAEHLQFAPEREVNKYALECIQKGGDRHECRTEAKKKAIEKFQNLSSEKQAKIKTQIKEHRKKAAELKKKHRKKFINMILNAKKECAGEDKKAARKCFREKVKTSIKDLLRKRRDAKKECRADLDKEASSDERKICIFGKVNTSGDTSTETSNDTSTETSGDTSTETSNDTSGDTSGNTSGDQ